LTRFVDKWQNLITSWFNHEREKADMAGSVAEAAALLAPTPTRAPGRRRNTAAPARAMAWFVAFAALVAGVVGCGGSEPAAHPSSSPVATSAPTSPPSSPSVRQTILAQYAAFWAQLTPVSEAPGGTRKAMLAPYAADPELSSLLRGMANADSKGQVFYGRNRPRPKVTQLSVSRGVAVVDDCQDSSHAGIANRSTHHPITVGVARNHVVVTMHLVGGMWRVVFVSYTRTKC